MSNHWFAQIVLILVTLLLVASCNILSKHQSINKQPESLQGKISLWAEMPLWLTEAQSSKSREIVRDTIEDFSELYPQVQVFIKFFPSRQLLEPFEEQVKRGAGPDLVLVFSSTRILQLIQTGALQSLENYQVERAAFRPEALKEVLYRGQLYGLPLFLSTQVLCYNKDLVQELPRTLPELIKVARQGYSVGLHSGFVEAFWGTGVFGGRLFDDRGRVILAEGGGWAKWMEWLKEAQNEPNFVLSEDTEALQQAFVEGKLTYLTCLSGWIPYFSEALGKERLGATLLPSEAHQPATPPLWASILLFNRASSPNQKRLALKLAQFLTNVEQQKQIRKVIPFIPSSKEVTINRQLFPILAVLLDQSKSSIAISLDDAEKVELLEDYGDILYQQVLKGEIAPNEAATKLTQTVNQQLGGG